MDSTIPAPLVSWTLTPALKIVTAFYVIRAHTLTDHRPILVLPNATQSEQHVLHSSRKRSRIFLSENDAVQKGQSAPEPYVLDYYQPFIIQVPSQYLQSPLEDVDKIISKYITTPQQHNLYGTLVLPAFLHTSTLFLHYRPLPTMFSLEHHTLHKPLRARITQRTKIHLRTRRMNGQYEQVYPEFSVVGSLGLYKERLGEEVLLLKAEGVTRSHPYQYIRLRVHVTHVSADIGFVLTIEAEWRFAAINMAGLRAQEDSRTMYPTNLRAQELVYAYTVICLREQTCTFP